MDRIALRERIDQFYEDVFPRLGSLTTPIPEAVRLVDWAFEEGHRVVIATNPLFPLKAIQHRLRWAGLPPEKYPFALVTSYETFHFTKETVAYYPEVLAQLGWPDDPVVMVGDDIEREVKPTQAAGLPVFWVRKPGELSAELADVPQGTLESFRDWLEKTDPDKLKVSLENPCALRMTLRSTPAALATIAIYAASKSLDTSTQPGEWCLTEIICHLRDVEREVNLPRIRKSAGRRESLPGRRSHRCLGEGTALCRPGRSSGAGGFHNRTQGSARIIGRTADRMVQAGPSRDLWPDLFTGIDRLRRRS